MLEKSVWDHKQCYDNLIDSATLEWKFQAVTQKKKKVSGAMVYPIHWIQIL